jgi:hypothetical protein
MRARPTGKERAVIRPITRLCCPHCRLRFTPAAAAYINACPECGESPQPIASLELTFGFRVLSPDDLPHELPYATAVSIALPRPESRTKPEVE